MKRIALFGISAIEAWDIGVCSHAMPLEQLDLTTLACNTAELLPFEDAFPQLTKPLHILSPSKGSRRQNGRWHCHVLSRELPRNSFFCVNENLLVAAPYLCFADLAAKLPVPLAVLLGMELCGRYSTLLLHEEAGRCEEGKGLLKRPPICSTSTLSRYLAAFGAGQRSVAQRALPALRNNSRSPMESKLHYLMSSRRSRGGYAANGYLINNEIELTDELARLNGDPKLECDFHWVNEKLVVEYDGKDYHTADWNRTHDNIKRLILEQLGIRVINIDKHQFYDMDLLDGVFQLISDHLGLPPVRLDPAARQARMELRNLLLDPDLNLYR